MSEPRYALIATVGTNDFRLPDSMLIELGKRQHNILDTFLPRYNHYSQDDYPDRYYQELVLYVTQLENERSHARKWGDEFQTKVKNNPAAANELTLKNFPFLNSALTNLTIDNGDFLGIHLKGIFLLTTDQPGKHSQDTIFYAEIIEQYLKQVAEDALPEDCEVSYLRPALQVSAADYDAVAPEVSSRLETLNKERGAEFDYFYIMPTAGTPAMSLALLHAASRVFGNKLKVISMPKEVGL